MQSNQLQSVAGPEPSEPKLKEVNRSLSKSKIDISAQSGKDSNSAPPPPAPAPVASKKKTSAPVKAPVETVQAKIEDDPQIPAEPVVQEGNNNGDVKLIF